MASRLPNDENEDAIRPLLGWDQAMAALQRNILQQNQQHQTSISQATAAAIAAGLTPPTSLPNPAISGLWPYNLPGTTSMLQPAAAAAAAASLASLSNPANSYMNHLQSLHNPESLLSFQQNLLLLEQLQQQRQLLASNPHLLMALHAAQTSNASVSPQTHSATNSHHFLQHQHEQTQHQNQLNLLNHSTLQLPINNIQSSNANSSPKLNGNTITTTAASSNGLSVHEGSSGSGGGGGSSFINNNTSLLTTVNSNLASALTNQHQDSLVDQHFRRSLGEDYNQIMSNKVDKINAAKRKSIKRNFRGKLALLFFLVAVLASCVSADGPQPCKYIKLKDESSSTEDKEAECAKCCVDNSLVMATSLNLCRCRTKNVGEE